MLFSRESVRHPMKLRRVRVSAVHQLAPALVRVTLSGESLADFASVGPADHVKLFFPDPATGVLTTPEAGPDGIRRPVEGVVLSRDYTPRASRPGELDVDFVVHGEEGPATAWASRASIGDELGVGGPRGSRLVPEGIGRLLVIADESAFPATARWRELLPASIPMTAIFDAADESVTGYFDELPLGQSPAGPIEAEWLFRRDGRGQLEEALRSLGAIADDTFVFLAGEADRLVPLRRYLRRELALPAEQVSASGYWRRGVTNLDHHAPLDPSDPD